MRRPSPQDLDRKLVRRLLATVRNTTRADLRIDLLSAELVGRPYQSNPLIGSAQSPEVFTARTDRFDCVTFLETVLALAYARHVDDFAEKLCLIRYASGNVNWHRRNHYMTEWIRENVRSGAIHRIPHLNRGITKDRTLNVVPGLGATHARFSCIPKYILLRSADKLRTGDLMFFASTRTDLDVFHCAIVIDNGNGLRIRHASRSQGAVVEQDLADFLKQNRMAGVMVVRPREDHPGASRHPSFKRRGVS
jgi:hypothetical protein